MTNTVTDELELAKTMLISLFNRVDFGKQIKVKISEECEGRINILSNLADLCLDVPIEEGDTFLLSKLYYIQGSYWEPSDMGEEIVCSYDQLEDTIIGAFVFIVTSFAENELYKYNDRVEQILLGGTDDYV